MVMKYLLIILFLLPTLVFSQDSKNREMQMQVNNLQPPPPPPPGPRGSLVKTNAFLTSSDFVFLQKPTYVGGWL